jgi:very-short-patch-repair endonuclease
MRHERAPAEHILWQCLRNRELNGFKFRRQVPIGSYIADFYCAEKSLVVELDGDSHSERQEYDAKRNYWMRERSLHVVRFINTDVFENLDAVLEAILEMCEKPVDGRFDPHPDPLPARERGQDHFTGGFSIK